MDVTNATFEQEVIRASAAVPVLVDFWAPWCAPCRALGPLLEKLEREYGGRFRLAKLNLDENPDLAAAFGVRSIPDVIAFRDGKPVAHFLGAQPEAAVRAFIDRLLPSASELERLAGGEASLRRALELDPRNDLARLDLAELLIGQKNAEFSVRWPNITRKGTPPPDADAWKGVSDKFEKHFSEEPGKGE